MNTKVVVLAALVAVALAVTCPPCDQTACNTALCGSAAPYYCESGRSAGGCGTTPEAWNNTKMCTAAVTLQTAQARASRVARAQRSSARMHADALSRRLTCALVARLSGDAPLHLASGLCSTRAPAAAMSPRARRSALRARRLNAVSTSAPQQIRSSAPLVPLRMVAATAQRTLEMPPSATTVVMLARAQHLHQLIPRNEAEFNL
eukprot:CAMPEP_0176431376 /NCGR_PEP_ID=MMETSP0127-20121128/14783_1 /TAXON_ID=938130 /ORGANISM="Platyophrya macrostoma, Strain WH" /LENGTH=204 /DNA_ID=CAMNT_0017813387 /DNA_START=54 /DNA_END=669 /DNA_ORIENTATION=+